MPFVSEVELFVVKHGLTAIKVFPASEGLFFFCVRRAYENGKRDFCHGSKLIVLSMRVGYLATESSRDTSCCVGSLKNSRITVTCGRQRFQVTFSKHFGACALKSAVQDCGRWLDQTDFRPMAELSFPVLVSPANAKGKETSASREIEVLHVWRNTVFCNCTLVASVISVR